MAHGVVLVPSLVAQQPRQRPDADRREELRAEVERRFAARVKEELQLNEEQATKMRATHDRYAERRRAIMVRQRDLRRALNDQMRPGQAANADSVQKLMDSARAGRLEMLEIEQAEDREMAGYLTPVQRARFQMMRQRFMERVRDVRRGRGGDRMRHREAPGRPPGRQPID